MGKFTASENWKLFVGGKGVTRDKYIFEKAEEAVRGHGKGFYSKDTEHGKLNEFEAIESFKQLTGLNVVYTEQEYMPINPNCGATPDAKVVDFSDVALASVDVKCPTESFFKQKMMMVNDAKPEYQNVPKEYFYQAQTQMMALTEYNRKRGLPPVETHYLVRYMTATEVDYEGNKVEYDIPLETRLYYKVITADNAIQKQILDLIDQAAKERDILIEIFLKPILNPIAA